MIIYHRSHQLKRTRNSYWIKIPKNFGLVTFTTFQKITFSLQLPIPKKIHVFTRRIARSNDFFSESTVGIYIHLERLLCPIFLGNVTPKTSNPVALKIGHKRLSRHVAFSGDINQPQQQKNKSTKSPRKTPPIPKPLIHLPTALPTRTNLKTCLPSTTQPKDEKFYTQKNPPSCHNPQNQPIPLTKCLKVKDRLVGPLPKGLYFLWFEKWGVIPYVTGHSVSS